jgi:hypothetical protein
VERARAAARSAAAAFAGLPAASVRDPLLASGRALRWSWIELQDHGYADEAWPMVAHALGLELPPPARSARPDLKVIGTACAATTSGVQCTTGGEVQLRFASGELVTARGATAVELASSVLDVLPAELAGCIVGSTPDGSFAAARIDRTQGAMSVSAGAAGLSLRGSFPTPGFRPRIVLDFAGNELRVLVQPVAESGAPADFTERIPLPKRLPRRRYEVEVLDADGALLAAAALDRR